MNSPTHNPAESTSGRDAASQASDHLPFPDFCNFGVVLRVLLAVNAVALLGAAAEAESVGHAIARFIDAAAIVEPATLFSLGALCFVRVRLSQETGWVRAAAAPLIAGAVTLLVDRATALIPGVQWRSAGNWFMPISAAAVAAAAAAAIVEYYRLRARAYSPAIAAARLQALQSRIRPHFLFNSLNAAIALVRTDPLRAELVLEDLSDLFRMLMKDARALITIEDEIKLAKQYLAIENLRLADRLRVDWQLNRVPTKMKLPPLLLQPLLENAIRHGIEPNEAPGTIGVRITGVARELIIVVENSYVPGEVVPGNRLALQNIRERLGLVYDLEASVKASGDGKLYRVSITLPIGSDGKEP